MRLVFRCACDGSRAYPIVLDQYPAMDAHIELVSGDVGIVRHLKSDFVLLVTGMLVSAVLLKGIRCDGRV